MYQENEKNVVEQIRTQYEVRGESKLEKLKKLDRRTKRPAEIFAYSFGIIGALVLGVGMCLAMKIIGNLMPLGIVIGCVGIAMVSVNYFIYKKIETSRKKKNANRVLSLADEMLNK